MKYKKDSVKEEENEDTRDFLLALDLLEALDKHGFSLNQKKIIKKIYGSTEWSNFKQWLTMCHQEVNNA